MGEYGWLYGGGLTAFRLVFTLMLDQRKVGPAGRFEQNVGTRFIATAATGTSLLAFIIT